MNKRLRSITFASALLLVLCLGVAQARTGAGDAARGRPSPVPPRQRQRRNPPRLASRATNIRVRLSPPNSTPSGYWCRRCRTRTSSDRPMVTSTKGQKLGAKMILYDAGGYQYIDKQVSQMEDLIASKVDAIVLVAINGAGTVGAVEHAVAAGIPVINCNVMTDSDKVVTRVRSDDEIIGQMQADYMGKLSGEGQRRHAARCGRNVVGGEPRQCLQEAAGGEAP